MGTSTYVKNNSGEHLTRGMRSLVNQVDIVLLVAVAFLLVFGLLMVYSASWNYALWEDQSTSFVLTRQMTWALLGGIAAIVLSRLDYHIFQRLGLLIMGGTLVLLVLVLVIKDTRLNATRTLYNGSIQPSELAKLALVIYLSVWLYSKRETLNNIWIGLTPMMLILGITSSLIFFQPDLSATVTVILLGGLMFFLAGGDLRQILLVVVASLLLGYLLYRITGIGEDRIVSYLDGLKSPLFASYHIKRSVEAIVRGGVLGVGIGKGTSKFTNLPFPWTDSIFAIIVEETGLLGAAFVIILYLVILWRGLVIAQRAPDQLGRLLASGLTVWIVLEAIINMGVMVNLVPFAGNALPLVSAGGSSMMTTLASFGIVMSVARCSNMKKDKKERKLPSAAIDLRRWDGRRSISSPERHSGNRN